MNPKVLVERIRKCRELAHMSERQLCDKAGVSPAYLQRLTTRAAENEHTTVRADHLVAIAAALGVDVRYLTGEIDELPDPHPTRAAAIRHARAIGIDEAAIEAIRREEPGRPLDEAQWTRRILDAALALQSDPKGDRSRRV